MTRALLIFPLIALLAGCADPNPALTFIPSNKSAVELRAAQSRLVPSDSDTVMRAVIATLHDLGYRITKAEPGAGTVSATRQVALRMAVVVQPRSTNQSVVRANATIVSLREEAQVDSAEFYNRNFFVPLGSALQRQLAAVPDDQVAPDPVRPTAELNTAKARQAAATKPLPPTSTIPK